MFLLGLLSLRLHGTLGYRLAFVTMFALDLNANGLDSLPPRSTLTPYPLIPPQTEHLGRVTYEHIQNLMNTYLGSGLDRQESLHDWNTHLLNAR